MSTHLTGFCTPGNPPASHGHCSGSYTRGPTYPDRVACECGCHHEAENSTLDSELGIELFALMDQAGITERLDFVADVVGRPIHTGADVTVADAEAAIKALRDLQTTEDPTDKEEDES